jgi:hypothetical protein
MKDCPATHSRIRTPRVPWIWTKIGSHDPRRQKYGHEVDSFNGNTTGTGTLTPLT